MVVTCMNIGCDEPILYNSDQCDYHTQEYEREEAAEGHTQAPCEEGHFLCAHEAGGTCHNYLYAEVIACPNEKCGQHEPEGFDE